MSRLWAITSYFNPAGYHSRLPNYRTFRENLGVPLATVELSFNGHFDLNEADADIMLRLRGNDVMWQKERLLNRVIDLLPEECDMVAWIDGDVIFESKDWVSHTIDALEQSSLVHLYEQRLNLPKDLTPENVFSEKNSKYTGLQTPSAVYLMSRSEGIDDDLRLADVPVLRRSTVGLAWASSRDILERHGLYDACIVGGADRVILCAAIGRFDFGIDATIMIGARKDHYLSWARQFYNSVQSRVGHIPGRVLHLWHGELQDRQYTNRHAILNKNAFDPFVDIAVDSQGLWRWASDKPQLHRRVREYFPSRFEDGISKKE